MRSERLLSPTLSSIFQMEEREPEVQQFFNHRQFVPFIHQHETS
jgi:hypothetical protein